MQIAGTRPNIISAAGHAQPQSGLQPETQIRVMKLDHQQFTDIQSERR
jgi:hypothetical protein